MTLHPKLFKKIFAAQKNEITEYQIYKNLAKKVKGDHNKRILETISAEEMAHYEFFKQFTKQDAAPSKLLVSFYSTLTRFFGLTFCVRLLEKNEKNAQEIYEELRSLGAQVDNIIEDESDHEQELLGLLDDKALRFTGSIVLGLNDALVELTGALAGLTLALQNTRLIAMAGAITGIAASLSMAASEYLSQKEEGTKDAFKASFYTGLTYTTVVLILIAPFFVFTNPLVCLVATLITAIFIIFFFTFYISVAKNLSFKTRFFEMAAISLSVAILNFGIGFLIKKYLNLDA